MTAGIRHSKHPTDPKAAGLPSAGANLLRLRTISEGELASVLAAHETYVASNGGAGKLADLSHVDLRGSRLEHACLHGVCAVGASLIAASLQGTNLSEADLSGASLRGAHLEGSNLSQAIANDCDFRTANLKHADCADVRGLLESQLAGASLAGATLPREIAKFDGLNHAQRVSQHAQRLSLVTLAASFYVWLTIAATTDANLVTNSASSALPIVQVEMAVVGFYVTAPLILLAAHLYYHVSAQRLWETIGSLPAIFPDGSPLDRTLELIHTPFARAHLELLRRDRPPLSRVQAGMSLLLTSWVVPLTILGVWFRYLPRHDLTVTTWHALVLTVAVAIAIGFNGLARATLRSLDVERPARSWSLPSPPTVTLAGMTLIIATAVVALVYVSADAMRSGKVRADLNGAELSIKPPSWTGHDAALVVGASLRGADLRWADARGAFLVKADLQGADLTRAFLVNADLHMADLDATRLERAFLVGANLRQAYLRRTVMHGSNLYRADLAGARLVGTLGLEAEQLRRAWNWPLVSTYATMPMDQIPMGQLLDGLGFPRDHGDRLAARDFREYDLEEARFYKADLSGFDFTRANLEGALLFHVDLQAASLEEANLSRANLGAYVYFEGENLQDGPGSNLKDANLNRALLHGANLTGAMNLTQEQIDKACIDDDTRLPHGLRRPTRRC